MSLARRSVGMVLLATLYGPGVAAAQDARLAPDVQQQYRVVVEALRAGDAGLAIRTFGTDVARRTLVGEYTDFLYAEALLRQGKWRAARQVAESVANRVPDRRVARTALLQAAYAAARAGDEARHEALLRRFLTRYAASSEMPEALYLLGASFEARGERHKAAETYRELRLLAPASEYADGAADRLDTLGRAGIVIPPLSPEASVVRAERLLRAGMVDRAREEAEAVSTAATGEPARRALRVVAMALERSRNYEAAASVTDRALAYATADQWPALRIASARLLFRAGLNAGALQALDELGTGRDSDLAEAAYLRARVLEDSARFSEAAVAYEQSIARSPTGEFAAAAMWRRGWLAYLDGDRARAAGHWLPLRETPPGHRYRLPATYWSGRAIEESGRAADARTLYERVLAEAPRGYYGILAAARVEAPPATPGELVVKLSAFPELGREAGLDGARIEALQRMGLPEFAAAELDELTLRSVADPARLYALAAEYARLGHHHLALRIVRIHFGDLVLQAHPDLPRAFWDVAYPLGWQTELGEAAAGAGLDPMLLAAVAREESNFDPRARSRAGARGLMQLMPQTARPLADRRDLPFRNGELLDEPGPNLELGAAVLADLLAEFADPRIAFAAYNAGAARARQWWAHRRTDDIDVFVEQIPYEETRLYVKRVAVSWAEYRRLYQKAPRS
jgi:soluble lytic murein transglycosylase